ncbi:MAG: 2-octaprenyl-6-methoxyphenyl hydroxylase [Gammaproteobacteria bacterium]|nr:2-octaprenyl-6-methoxyphenyl hydroxylase [Gammaproteobacteria bacterium]
MTRDDYDILVVGGGLAGASLAAALADSDVRIGLIEAVPPDASSQPSYDDRGIALAYGSRQIFAGIGVWPRLESVAEPIRRIHVSDRGGFGAMRMSSREVGYDALGYVALARDLGHALMERIGPVPTIEIITPASLAGFSEAGDNVQVDIEAADGRRTLSCRLLVGADGMNSEVRRMVGIEIERHGYGQTAVIANVTPGLRHDGRAFERFTPTGPLALLPLTPDSCSLVWTHPDHEADSVVALDDGAFLERLQEAFGYRLGRFQRVGARQSYPLSFLRARQYARGRVALIGNAAHTLHPVAGQGFNLGLRDVAVLAEQVDRARRKGEDIGAPAVLDAYARLRKGDLARTGGLTDSLVRIFSNSYAPLSVARDLGLIGMDLCSALRHGFMHRTMGLGGEAPKLLRGVPLNGASRRKGHVVA